MQQHRSTPTTLAAQAPLDRVSSLACRIMARMASWSGLDNRLSILIYHRVLAQPDPLFPFEVDAASFDRQLGLLKQCFNIVPLGSALAHLRNRTLPPRAACVTFDDGYADNAEVALPILERHGVSATFFVATGFLNGGRMWNDTIIELVRGATSEIDLTPLGLGRFGIDSLGQRQAAIASLLGALKYLPLEARTERVAALCQRIPVALPDNLMMVDDQVRQLHRAGMEIGGHTVRHPILARLNRTAAREEIAEGKAALERLVGVPIRVFAYPNGRPGQDYQSEHATMVKDLGFDAAVSTSWGAATAASDIYQLPRFTPWDPSPVRFTLRMMQNLAKSGATV